MNEIKMDVQCPTCEAIRLVILHPVKDSVLEREAKRIAGGFINAVYSYAGHSPCECGQMLMVTLTVTSHNNSVSHE